MADKGGAALCPTMEAIRSAVAEGLLGSMNPVPGGDKGEEKGQGG